MIIGKKVTPTAIITNTPKPDFKSDTLPDTVRYASDSAEPTTGTKELSAKRTVLPDTLSSEPASTCLMPRTEVKIVITNAKIHLNAFEINDVKPLRLMPGESPPDMLIPKNIFKNGTIIFCAVCATPCPAAITEAQYAAEPNA